MIRSPIGLRLVGEPGVSAREQVREAATLGAKGVLMEAAGELSPDRLSETGRRDLRQVLRSTQLQLVALSLPTRRPFDTYDDLEARVSRASRAFAMAYELGCTLVVARVGPIPTDSEADAARRLALSHAIEELARAADHQGVRFGIETGTESGAVLRDFLKSVGAPLVGASIDPGALLRQGIDPAVATRELGELVFHAYARDASGMSDGGPIASNPRGFGFAPGVIDWEEFLGSLEEINYRGFLTIWPSSASAAPREFRELNERFRRF